MPQVDSIESYETLLPFWDVQRAGGVPTMADPERFIWLSWVMNASDTSANLQVNLAFIFGALLNAFGAYFLARQLRLTPYLSALVALALVTSQDILLVFLTGRLNPLIGQGLSLVGMACLVRSIGAGFAPLPFAVAAVALAVALVANGQYALVFPLLPMVALVWAAYCERRGGWIRAIPPTLLTTAMLGFVSTCLAAPWLVPLLLTHLAADLSSTRELAWNYPALFALPGLLIPLTLDTLLTDKQAVPLVAPLVCGGVLIVALRKARLANNPYALAFIGIILVSLVGLLVGGIPVLRDVAVHIPILGGLRQSLAFSSLFTLGSVYLAALSMRALVAHAEPVLVRSRALLITTIVIVLLSYLANIEFLIENATLLTLAAVPIAALVVAVAWRGSANLSAGRAESLFAVLVATGLIANLPSAAIRSLQPNAMSPPAVAAPLKADMSYYKVFCFRWRDIFDCKVPGTLVENLGGFSLYFLPAHERLLGLLTGREIEERRPHWATRDIDCRELDPLILALANVKYVLCPHDRTLTEANTSVGQLDRRRLLQRDHWRSALHVYGASVPERDLNAMDLAMVRKHIVNAQESGAVVLDGGAQIEGDKTSASELVQSVSLEKLGANELRIRVEVDRPGVLVVPEYWAPGWSAKVNGEPVTMRRAFYLYRAVKVPAGKSAVVLSYWPPGLTSGLIAFVAVILLFVIAIFVSWLWPRSKPLKMASTLEAPSPPSP